MPWSTRLRDRTVLITVPVPGSSPVQIRLKGRNINPQADLVIEAPKAVRIDVEEPRLGRPLTLVTPARRDVLEDDEPDRPDTVADVPRWPRD